MHTQNLRARRRQTRKFRNIFRRATKDLDPDAYRNVPNAEGSSESYTEGNPEPDESEAILSDPSYESFADAEAARQDRRNNRKNWKQNARQDNFRGNYQQNRQQNRQQQNRQQNQQRQNRNIPQQNRQQQNRQQNQQQQRQQQNKPKKNIWKQAENDAEAMNPGNLPEWDTLKTEAGICQWIERLFEGKTAEPAAEESPENFGRRRSRNAYAVRNRVRIRNAYAVRSRKDYLSRSRSRISKRVWY